MWWKNRFLLVVSVALRCFAAVPIVVEGFVASSPSNIFVNNKPRIAIRAATAEAKESNLTPMTETSATTKATVTDNNNSTRNNNNDDDDDDDLESKVIISIQNVVSSASNITQNPRNFFSTMGDFGQSSGALISKKWLTPESLEVCALFWDDGFRVLMRDLFRSYVFSNKPTRYKFNDWIALGWFLLLASGSSILFLPLLLPLIKAGLEEIDIDENTYLPPSFGSTRLAAMRRLRSPEEPQTLEQYLEHNPGTPRNVQEGLAFFRDGTLLLARDIKRGELTNRNDDAWGTYAWFAFLVFSSFPITPLIIPLIDRRRANNNEENNDDDGVAKTSDYVPSSYRPERLKALARLRDIEAVRLSSPVDVLRAVAAPPIDANNKKNHRPPPPEMLLEAIVKAQQQQQLGGGGNKKLREERSLSFLNALAGVPGRRWELAYVAGKPAVVAMRKQIAGNSNTSSGSSSNNNSSSESWYRPLERFFLPWTRLRDGLYVDPGLVSAIQNFDARSMQNKNGVFRILRSDFFETTVEGPFSWNGQCKATIFANNNSNDDNNNRSSSSIPEKAEHATEDAIATTSKQSSSNNKSTSYGGGGGGASICAFRPNKATFRLGPWWKIEQDIPEETPFDETHVRDLPFFKFIHVDDKVAVAMGRSGSVALWTRMDE